MFCPSCGAEYAIGLNYCNRCGANLNTTVTEAELAPVSVTKPTIVIGLVLMTITLGGFAGLFEGATRLGEVLHQTDPVIATIVMGMITIMVADIMLLIQLSRLINAALHRPALKKLPKQEAAKQIAAPVAPVAYTPMSSVTDHTTRTLEPAYRKPVERNQAIKSTPE